MITKMRQKLYLRATSVWSATRARLNWYLHIPRSISTEYLNIKQCRVLRHKNLTGRMSHNNKLLGRHVHRASLSPGARGQSNTVTGGEGRGVSFALLSLQLSRGIFGLSPQSAQYKRVYYRDPFVWNIFSTNWKFLFLLKFQPVSSMTIYFGSFLSRPFSSCWFSVFGPIPIIPFARRSGFHRSEDLLPWVDCLFFLEISPSSVGDYFSVRLLSFIRFFWFAFFLFLLGFFLFFFFFVSSVSDVTEPSSLLRRRSFGSSRISPQRPALRDNHVHTSGVALLRNANIGYAGWQLNDTMSQYQQQTFWSITWPFVPSAKKIWQIPAYWIWRLIKLKHRRTIIIYGRLGLRSYLTKSGRIISWRLIGSYRGTNINKGIQMYFNE